ncbi:MAG: hypothetical protein JRI34_13445, partial [Deltaproteobacteria bacterium]|nr:hypothetical protein [Deltaproteobacteria bacterium]
EDVSWDDIKIVVHPTVAGKEIMAMFKTAVSLNTPHLQGIAPTSKGPPSKLKLDID